jgi:hypothetical protein
MSFVFDKMKNILMKEELDIYMSYSAQSTNNPLSNGIINYMIPFEFVKFYIMLKHHPQIRLSMYHSNLFTSICLVLTVLLIFALVKGGVRSGDFGGPS